MKARLVAELGRESVNVGAVRVRVSELNNFLKRDESEAEKERRRKREGVREQKRESVRMRKGSVRVCVSEGARQ